MPTKNFRWKINLQKAAGAFALGAIPAATLCLEDALKKGEFDMKKVAIGFSISVTFAGLKSLHNWAKINFPKDVLNPES